MKVVDIFSASKVVSLRTEETMPRSVRLAQYPNGTQVLQGAYYWAQGFATGFNWKDLPVIMVDSQGEEFDND